MHNKTIGQRIREERKRQGLTMAQLGEKMGISGSLVGRYERNEENPKIETVERFANALGVLVSSLYSDPEEAYDVEYRLINSNSQALFCMKARQQASCTDSSSCRITLTKILSHISQVYVGSIVTSRKISRPDTALGIFLA